MLAAVSDASSGHLRRCSHADTVKESLSRDKDASIPSWPTMMESNARVITPSHIGCHQVTYEVSAWLIQ
eukprot:scaffold3623_cov117-Skeletonema_marinoi.AAC.2